MLFLGCVNGLGQGLAILWEINFDGHDNLGDSQDIVNGVWAAGYLESLSSSLYTFNTTKQMQTCASILFSLK